MEHRPLISLDVTGLARLRHDLLDQGDSISRLVWRRQADIWNRQGFSVDCIESARMCRPTDSKLPSGALVALTTGQNGDLPAGKESWSV